jgi:hypothetical protein
MILVDANLLVFAHVSDFLEHGAALDWLDAALNGTGPVGLPWPSLLTFVRLTTNPRIFERPLAMAEAWSQVTAWLDVPSATIPTPTVNHAQVMASLMPAVTRSNLLPDAHVAALAIEHGLVLCSTDGDFARFEGLRWQNPLA